MLASSEPVKLRVYPGTLAFVIIGWTGLIPISISWGEARLFRGDQGSARSEVQITSYGHRKTFRAFQCSNSLGHQFYHINMSQLQGEYVKRGFWTNHEVGPILGKTLTTDVRTGNLVVALLAVLTTFGLGHLWNLVIFAYHQARAHGRDSDGHFYQQQALLRTLPPPNAVATTWIKLWWSWRGKSNQAFSRTWLLAVTSIMFTAATIGVGVFVSYAISNSNIEVLVDSPLCASIAMDRYINMTQDVIAFEQYFASLKSASRSYSRECYQDLANLPARCLAFVRPSVAFTRTRQDCPFSGLCANITQPGVLMDSGLVDVNDAFGLNLQLHDGVGFRKRNVCSFLRIEGHYDVQRFTYNHTQYLWDEHLDLFFGNTKDEPSARNRTLGISLLRSNYTTSYGTATSVYYDNLPDRDNWIPLPEFHAKNADLALVVILKNRVRYVQRVDDPFFAAHKAVEDNDTPLNLTYYRSDFPVATLACREQYQFCFTQVNTSQFCSDLQGISLYARNQAFPGANSVQLALIEALKFSAFNMNIQSVATAGVSVADSFLFSNIMPGLPDDQWLQELIAWEAQFWSGLQIAIADRAIGYAARDPAMKRCMKSENATSGEKKLCQSQRMRVSGGFVNINVFALALVISLTSVFTLLEIILLRILIFTQRFRRALAPRIDRWIQDGVFHLQRRAYEAQEQAAWTRLDREIPTTLEKVPLPQLNISVGAAISSNAANKSSSGQSTGTAASSNVTGPTTLPLAQDTSNASSAAQGQPDTITVSDTGAAQGSAATSNISTPPSASQPPTQPIAQPPAQPVTQAHSQRNNQSIAQLNGQSSTHNTPALPTATPAAPTTPIAQTTRTP